jgi:hypothetical protein
MFSVATRYAAAAGLGTAAGAVARRQLARLHLERARKQTTARPASRWAHVPLAALFERSGNVLHPRSNGTVVTGHEPVHRSRSGRCVVLWPTDGRWWCSSCRRGGDAVRAVMSLEGVPYRAALAQLIQRYGAPAGGFRGRVRGLVVEVGSCD